MKREYKLLIKNLSLYIGSIGIFVCGLFFVLFTDLYLSNTSQSLFFAILFAFGSGIPIILAEKLKEKLAWFYTLKGVGAGLGIGYIIYLFVFRASESSVYGNTTYLKLFKTYQEKTISLFNDNFAQRGMKIPLEYGGLYVALIVITFVVVAMQLANIASNLIFKPEE